MNFYIEHPRKLIVFAWISKTFINRLSLWLRICLQCRRPGFNPWVGKIPWRREQLPTPVFWPGEFHGLYSPWDSRESDTTERLSLFSQVKYIHFLCKQTRTFSSGKTEILPIQQQPPFLLSQFLVITILLSVSMILTTLGTSFQQNQSIFVLSWKAYFTWQNVYQVYACCSMCQNPLLF